MGGGLEVPLDPLSKVNVKGYATMAAHVIEGALQPPTSIAATPSSTTSSIEYLIHKTMDQSSPNLNFEQQKQ